jgi:hypothetical protein
VNVGRNVDGSGAPNKARSHCCGTPCYTGRMSTRSSVESVTFDAYVIDTLMHDLIGHDRAASAFVVYLYLWRESLGRNAPTVQTSLRTIAEGTGLSKRGVQDALSALARRRLIGIARQTITDIPVYTVRRPWKR